MDAPLQASVKIEIPSPSCSEKQPSRSSDAGTRAAYMCRKCKVHRRTVPVRRHKRVCPFKECFCEACQLVNKGRTIVAQQIALYRNQKDKTIPGSEHNTAYTVQSQTGQDLGPIQALNVATGWASYPSMQASNKASICNRDGGPHCRKCRNHNEINPWKGHKKHCPYKDCMCEACKLITERKFNEKSLRDLETHNAQSHVDVVKNQVTDTHISKMMPTGAYTFNTLGTMPTPQAPSLSDYSYNASLTAGRPNAWTHNGVYSNASSCWDPKLSSQPPVNPYSHTYNPMVMPPNHFPASGMQLSFPIAPHHSISENRPNDDLFHQRW